MDRKPRPTYMGAQLRRKYQAYSQPLSGREREGGAFLRKAASLAITNIPIGRGGSVSRRDRNQWTGNRTRLAWERNYGGSNQAYSQPLSGREREGGAFLRKAASLTITNIPIGRGGSVSRRDQNQLTRNRAQLAWGRNYGGSTKPIPSYSSGGSAREALLLEKRPPSHTPHHTLGGFL